MLSLEVSHCAFNGPEFSAYKHLKPFDGSLEELPSKDQIWPIHASFLTHLAPVAASLTDSQVSRQLS